MRDVGVQTVKRYIKKNHVFEVENLEDDYSGLTVDMDGMTWLVYVPDTSAGDLVWLVRTLSHEANHVALQMMRKIGVEDDETICYVQDNLLGQLLSRVIKTEKAS